MLTALRRRRAHALAAPDAGMSLTELLIAMSLMSIIGALSLTYFVGSHTAADRTTDEGLKLAQARTAMSTAMRELQLADSPATAGAATGRFDAVTATQLTFYANDIANRTGSGVRGAPARISLTLDQAAHTLTMVRWTPVVTNGTASWPTPSAPRVLATDLATTSAFSCTADGVTCLPATAATPVTSVTVSLTVTGYAGKPAQTLVSSAAMNGVV